MSLPLDSVVLSLQDLIFYFRPPEEELEHEEKQTKLRSLRNRQNLFQEEVSHTYTNEYFPTKAHLMHEMYKSAHKGRVYHLLLCIGHDLTCAGLR